MVQENYKGYRSRIINPVSEEKVIDIEDGLLVVDKQGKIIQCKEYSNDFKGQVVDLRGSLIIPGLIDCHLHLPQLDCRGKHGATLLGWLKKYIFPAEQSFSNLEIVDDVAKRFFKKLILNGTTTSAVYNTIHYEATNHVFKLAKQCGVRSIIGKVMMDQNSPDGLLEKTSDSLKQSEDLAGKWHNAENGRLQYAFTPRFAPTCSKKMWIEIGKLISKTGAYLQSHIAETKEENKFVLELFPEYDSVFDVFDKTGCATPKTILGHAIHLTDEEYNRMSSTGTKIAHCPSSNFFLKSGWMPLARVEKANVVHGLATDIGAGPSMSLFTEMRHADYTQLETIVTPVKALYLATLAGAYTLSMEDEIGNFEKDKWADFAVLDITNIDFHYKLSDLSTDEILSLLMYRGNGRVVKSTYVAGKELDVDCLQLDSKKPRVYYY